MSQDLFHRISHLLVELDLLLEEDLVGGLDVLHPLLVEGIHLEEEEEEEEEREEDRKEGGGERWRERRERRGRRRREEGEEANFREEGVGDGVRPLPDAQGHGGALPIHLPPLPLGALGGRRRKGSGEEEGEGG